MLQTPEIMDINIVFLVPQTIQIWYLYRQFTRWCWGWLGRSVRVVLPSCAESETLSLLHPYTQDSSIQIPKIQVLSDVMTSSLHHPVLPLSPYFSHPVLYPSPIGPFMQCPLCSPSISLSIHVHSSPALLFHHSLAPSSCSV